MEFIILISAIALFYYLTKPIIIRNPVSRKISSNNRTKRYRAYLKTDAWRRKRYVVLKRDNWTCQYCGTKATEVHHLKYAKYNIGKEPIKWLVSICAPCHRKQH